MLEKLGRLLKLDSIPFTDETIQVILFDNGSGQFNMPAEVVRCGRYILALVDEPHRTIFVNATTHETAFFVPG